MRLYFFPAGKENETKHEDDFYVPTLIGLTSCAVLICPNGSTQCELIIQELDEECECSARVLFQDECNDYFIYD
ncbi:hypothetical protein V5799_014733 [Amblyomma americanum]|uniref:Uncharacterized protein n=1 Tax=Amblyomma americanum TaxID=6943 RepID=A0AAQ4E263_AMBAM